MRFFLVLFAVLLTVLPAVLAHNPKPSSTPTNPGWHCPDTDLRSRTKIEEYCDKPPHKGIYFGCTYHDGKGGNYVCTFDSKSGEWTGGGEHCPKNANYHAGSRVFKRPSQPKPSPSTPTPTPTKHVAGRYMMYKRQHQA